MTLHEENITQEQIRAGIDSQTCPWCGKGPFKVLAVHTNKVHAIDKWHLRDLAGYTVGTSICDPQFSANAAEHAIRRQFHQIGNEAVRKHGRAPQRMTRAGKANLKANLVNWMTANPKDFEIAQQRAVVISNSPEIRAQAAVKMRQWHAEHPEASKAAVEKMLTAARTPEVQERQRAAAAKRRIRGHGTRACYRRGCRQPECRQAYLDYRKLHG